MDDAMEVESDELASEPRAESASLASDVWTTVSKEKPPDRGHAIRQCRCAHLGPAERTARAWRPRSWAAPVEVASYLGVERCGGEGPPPRRKELFRQIFWGFCNNAKRIANRST